MEYYWQNKGALFLGRRKQSFHRTGDGRLKKNQRHNNTDTIQMEYNIRNQITKIKSGDFVQNLYYNTNLPNGANACYNGNIAANTWKYNGATNGYVYNYDGLNRLTYNYSIINNYIDADAGYMENFEYDKHGNVKGIYRSSPTDFLDNLFLTYNGNQLQTVYDYEGNVNLYNVKEYKDRGYNPVKFTYDDNGNMKYDFDRNIVTIRYNLLNLPDTIQFENGNQIINKYNAAGKKLETKYFTRLSPVTVPVGTTRQWTYELDVTDLSGTSYIDNIEYSLDPTIWNYGLSRVHNPEGYTTNLSASSPWYHYYRKDHLGNNREVWRASYMSGSTQYAAATVQRTQYYPSGLPWRDGLAPSAQPYKYEGKEFIEMHGYDMYDSQFRMYDPLVMRTPTQDRLAEKYPGISPYAWCANNPVRFIDPDGRDFWDFDGDYKKSFIYHPPERPFRDIGPLIWSNDIFRNNPKDLFSVKFDPKDPEKSVKEHEQKLKILETITEVIQAVADILSFFHPVAGSLAEVGANADVGNYGAALAALPFLALDIATMGEGSSVKGGNNLLKLAKKYGINANSPTTKQLLESFDMKAADWISKYRQGKIKSVLGDVGEKTIGEVFDAADSKTRKMILDGRFAK